MFKAYDTREFGKYMRTVRKSLNLTQQEVENKSNVNIETLRRLEQGKVIPKYETIEFLSTVYKQDLLSIFAIHRTSRVMYEFYDHLDEIIVSYDLDKMKNLEEEFEGILSNKEMSTVIDQTQILQLKVFLKAINSYYKEDYEPALKYLKEAIYYSNETFKIKNFKKEKYDLLESRMLLLMSLTYSGLKQKKMAIEILKFVYKQLNSSQHHTENHMKLIIKILFSLSYECYSINDLKHSLSYANDGIKFCKAHSSFYMLFALYYRRAVAKYMLGKKNYMEDFHFCITLLEIQGKKDLIKIYKKSTLDRHNLKI